MMENSVDLPKFTYRTAIDGIRGLASLAIVLYHANTPGFTRGYAGVDVFFVLAGFLWTSSLLREGSEKKRIDIVDFYLRRARRLLPLSLIVLMVTLISHRLISHPLVFAEHRRSFVAAALMHSNWRMLIDSVDYFGSTMISPVQHYWSLSLLEQMSIVIPILLWLTMAFSSYRARSAFPVAILTFIACLSLLWAFKMSEKFPMWAYLGTFERSYQFLTGAVLAALILLIDFPSQNRKFGTILSMIGLFGFLALVPDFKLNATLVGMISTAVTTTLLTGLEINHNGLVGAILSNPVLRKMGDLSFGVYLWHFPIIIIGNVVGFPASQPMRTIVLVVLSYAITYPTHRFIEEPCRKYSTLHKLKFIFVALACSVCIAFFSWQLLKGNEVPQDISNNAPDARVEEQSPPPSKIFKLPPTRRPTRKPRTCSPRKLKEKTARILIVGDAVADRWRISFQSILRSAVSSWDDDCPWFTKEKAWVSEDITVLYPDSK